MALLGHNKQQWLVQATLRQFCFIILYLSFMSWKIFYLAYVPRLFIVKADMFG